jgi:hypothetical protein
VLRDGAPRLRTLKKGLRERLLCAACEGRIQRLEDYFARAWNQNAMIQGELTGGDIVLRGLDYAALKLFLLSIVWRASASRLQDFRAVRLGPHHERIRQMLLNRHPGAVDDYRIFAGLIWDADTKRVWDKVIMTPVRIKVSGLWAYRLIFAGASWTVMVSRHAHPLGDRFCLTEEGALPLTCSPWQRVAQLAGALDVVGQFPD